MPLDTLRISTRMASACD